MRFFSVFHLSWHNLDFYAWAEVWGHVKSNSLIKSLADDNEKCLEMSAQRNFVMKDWMVVTHCFTSFHSHSHSENLFCYFILIEPSLIFHSSLINFHFLTVCMCTNYYGWKFSIKVSWIKVVWMRFKRENVL